MIARSGAISEYSECIHTQCEERLTQNRRRQAQGIDWLPQPHLSESEDRGLHCVRSSREAGVHHRLTIAQRASFDHVDRFPAALKYLGESLQDGSLKRKFHVVEGLENAPSALNLLFTGGNTGKLSVLGWLF